MNLTPFSLRMVQLDLARQKESVPFLREFIDFARSAGYNAVQLYLEGRIKTASFHARPDCEYYTPEEMHELVAYAAKRGIELIPVVSLLGHAEHFLECEEFAHLSEMRDGIRNRFGGTQRQEFCPSLPEAWAFIEAYVAEICAIFPSRYFHAGCDEAFSIGVCPLCAAEAAKNGLGPLYLRHFLRCHELLKRHGKRMIVWDDLFELFPGTLEQLPRDIILESWCYLDDARHYCGHFCNSRFGDVLRYYHELGFECIASPSDFTYQNTASYVEYARTRPVLGVLITVWVRHSSFMHQSLPALFAAGRLLNAAPESDPEEIFRTATAEYFGCSDPELSSAVRGFNTLKMYREFESADEFLTRMHVHRSAPEPVRALDRLALNVLRRYAGSFPDDQRNEVIAELVLSIRGRMLADSLNRILYDMYALPELRDRLRAALPAALTELRAIAAERSAMWQRVRAGVEPDRMAALYANYEASVRDTAGRADTCGTLELLFSAPEQYSVPVVTLELRYAGSTEFEPVASGVWKSPDLAVNNYRRIFATDPARHPEQLRISLHGYGGCGFCFARLVNAAGTFVPGAIHAATGSVIAPEKLLQPDLQWCYLGIQDPVPAVHNPALAAQRHTVELNLIPERTALHG